MDGKANQSKGKQIAMNNINDQIAIPYKPHLVTGTEIKDLPESIVLGCQSIQAAYRLAFSQADIKRTDEDWARALGEDPGTFNLIINNDSIRERKDRAGLKHRNRHVPDTWFLTVPELTGNNAVGQWMYLYPRRRQILEDINEQRRQELLAELQRLNG